MSDVELLPVESSTLMDSYGHVGNILNSLRQQRLKNAMMQTQNQYLPTHLQNANRAQELQNQQQLTTNEFLPNKLRAAIDAQKIENNYGLSRNRYADDYFKNRNALTSAQVNNLNEKTSNPLSGITTGPYAQIHALQVLTEKFGPDNEEVKRLRDRLGAEVDQMRSRAKFYGSNTQLKGLTAPQKDAYVATHGLPDLGIAPGDADDPMSLKNASLGDLAKKTNTTQALNQQLFAKTAGALYNQGSQFIPSVSKFAGYGGSTKQVIERLKSGSLGTNNPDYLNLLKFQQTATNIANELRRQLGANASDAETKIMQQVVSPTLWDKSPAQILSLWKNLGDILNTASAQLKGNAGTLQKGLGHEATILGTAPTYSDEDIAHTAKLYKMTPEQVRKKLEQMNAG